MTTNRYAKSAALSQQAARHIAGGVVSLNRKVDPDIAFVKALGSRLWDADGNEYIDYHAAFAPHILGHNDPEVNGKVREAMESHWSLMGSGTTTWEVHLAELIRKCVPSLERIQITNTGSEATAHAIRLSRAYTGRDDIILPLGGYNGWHNDVARMVAPPLTETGPRVSPGEYKFLPSSAGIPDATARKIHLVNYNDIDLCLRAREAGYRVICEAGATLRHYECQTRRGVVSPEEQARWHSRWGKLLHAAFSVPAETT